MSSFLSEPSPKPAISPGNPGSCEQRKVFRPVTRYAHGHRDATISSPFSGQSEETRKCARTHLHLHFFVGPSVKPCLRPSTSNARAASVLTVGSPFPNCSSRVRQGTPSSIFLTLSPLCGSRFLTGQVLPACLGPWLGLGAASSPTSAGAQFAHLAAFPPAPPGVGQRHSSCLAHEAGAPSSAATRPPSRLPSRDSAERARGAVSGHRGLCPATHTCTRWR